jgi:hypothetical protein
METVSLNIPQLFKDVYDIYARFPVYVLGDKKPGTKPAPVKTEDWNLEPYLIPENTELSSAGSPFGVPLFDVFQFGEPVGGFLQPTYTLPIACVVEVSKTKTVVKTPRVGKKGTVKELMTQGDDLVTFKGFVINYENKNQYPVEETKRLNEWFEKSASIPVFSKLLNEIFGVNNVVFEELKLPPLEGVANCQPFELIGYSDEDIILEL